MTRSEKWQRWKLGLAGSLAIGAAIVASDVCALAQIIPDTTLSPRERSLVSPGPIFQIDGGAIRGNNLFHSFVQFSVPTGGTAFFNNIPTIVNIISRVTGTSISNIDGLIQANGKANVFLINPNGIIFGANAQLSIGGSFVATTANAIQFGNQGFFSASTPNVPPVLTVNPSALLFNQIAVASITNNSKAPAGSYQLGGALSDINVPLFGLRVPDGKSLLLVGGNVSSDGGGLNALGGRVELSGVAGTGTVGLDVNGNNLRLSFPDSVAPADITLTHGASVDASGEGGGNIQVQGRRVMLSDGSQIVANTLGSKPGGALIINASDSVELIGSSPGGSLTTQTQGTGDAGNITIYTGKLIVRDGAQISSSTLGKGSGGQLTVNAFKSVELIGAASDGSNSGLFSSTFAAGDGGDITITTSRLMVRDKAAISAGSDNLIDSSGRYIPATGRGGHLTINASESVEVTGGLVATETSGLGDAGDVTLTTGKLIVQNGGEVSLSSAVPKDVIYLGDLHNLGKAGELNITARSILLDNPGKLIAETDLGQGGNINIRAQDSLLLRHNSQISTSAGIARAGGDGGNIKLTTPLLITVTQENSHITANAYTGKGGRVQIATQGIFGFQFPKQPTSLSDITASSQFGVNGVVQISNPAIDPNHGLVVLPAQPVDVTRLVAQNCPTGGGYVARGSSKFTIAGRGGLPPTPRETLGSDNVLEDWGSHVLAFAQLPREDQLSRPAVSTTQPTPPKPEPFVEAQGWVLDTNGKVVLTANVPPITPHNSRLTPPNCPGS